MSEFHWRTPVTLASQAFLAELKPEAARFRPDYNGFMDYLAALEDPLGADLADLCRSPFELPEIRSSDPLIKGRLLYIQGKIDEIRKLYWPESESAETITPEMLTSTEPNRVAIWALANSRFLPSEKYTPVLAELAKDAAELEPPLARAVAVRHAIDLAWAGLAGDEIRKTLERAFSDPVERDSVLARVLNKANRFQEADVLLAALSQTTGSNALLDIERGLSSMGLGQPSRAREKFRAALNYNSFLGEALVGLSLTESWQRRYEEAIGGFEDASKIDPFEPALYPVWAQALSDVGRIDSARDAISNGLDLFPDNVQVRLTSAQLYLNAGDFENSLAEFRAAAVLAPIMARPHSEIGAILVRMGKPEEARGAFEKAIKLGQPEGEVEAAWGRALFDSERYREAVPHLEKASGLKPKDAGLHALLARAYEGAGDLARAAAEYEAAVTYDSYDKDSAVKGALAYANLGDVEKSLKMLDRSVDAGWIDTEFVVKNFPDSVKSRPEFKNILANMNPGYSG
ncbi:MAG: tetratricopeptide repeat protein [bacterium]